MSREERVGVVEGLTGRRESASSAFPVVHPNTWTHVTKKQIFQAYQHRLPYQCFTRAIFQSMRFYKSQANGCQFAWKPCFRGH